MRGLNFFILISLVMAVLMTGCNVASKEPGDWDNKGVALSEIGRYEEALDAFNKSIEFNPNYVRGWDHKGIVLSKLGRYKEALFAFDKAIIIDPNYGLAKENKNNLLKSHPEILESSPTPTPTVTSTPTLAIENQDSELEDYLPDYSGGSTVHITNSIGKDATVVWTNIGTKNKVFVVTIPGGNTKTVSVPSGSFDEYLKAGLWYKAGTDTFSSNNVYNLKYYFGSFGNGLVSIPDSEAPAI